MSTEEIEKNRKKRKSVAVIVAHPDDETLWAGGTILSHPEWDLYVISLCRANDPNRAPKFYKALKVLGAEGKMGDLDDSQEQKPFQSTEVEQVILELLPSKHFDLIITHNPSGEYTRHIRHEETGKAVIKLWHQMKISATELWSFAYQDGGLEYYPKPVETANIYRLLIQQAWLKKYRIITETYGFGANSWEATTTPKAEAFWQFKNAGDAMHWLSKGEIV